MKDYQERKCQNCGGGKFIQMVWGLECWYCGSEYEHKPAVVVSASPYRSSGRYYTSSLATTYFAPTSPRRFWGDNW